jgi:tetratricopeptide (TPR) repeat protein
MRGLLTLLAAGCAAAFALAAHAEDGARLSQSLAAAEQRLGPSHPDLLALIEPLAQARFRDGDFAAATALHRRALRIAREAFGPASVEAAEARVALALSYVEMQRYLDAEPLLIGARIDLTQALGADAPALAPVLCALARIAAARGADRDAVAFARQAVAIDASREPLRVLGAALAGAEQFEESERTLERAVAEARAGEGADGLATARALRQLAELYLRQQRFAEAVPPVEEAISIDQAQLGAGHPLLGGDWHDLGAAYLGEGRLAEAEKAFRQAVDVLQRGPARGTPLTANVELGLARVSQQQGHEREAQALFEDARRLLDNGEREEREREREI